MKNLKFEGTMVNLCQNVTDRDISIQSVAHYCENIRGSHIIVADKSILDQFVVLFGSILLWSFSEVV